MVPYYLHQPCVIKLGAIQPAYTHTAPGYSEHIHDQE